MNNQAHRLGFDRFMALRWVNMALELRLLNQDPDHAFRQLKEWLSKEISGRETARKTATQTRRLWLAKHDEYDALRQIAINNGLADNQNHWPLLHYGLSLNVFPLFWDVCQATGRLLNLQATCHRKDIHQRVQENYGNPASTRTATDRVFQTLVDWGLLNDRDGKISANEILIDDTKITQWLITALMFARATDKLPLVDITKAPELLGLRFMDTRSSIRSTTHLKIERVLNVELVIINDFYGFNS